MEVLRILLTEPWWIYDADTVRFWGRIYRAFNLLEGIIWIAVAGVVFRRYIVWQTSSWDLLYGLLFVAFGLSDFREAQVESAALVAVKAMILAGLIYVRSRLTTRPSGRGVLNLQSPTD